MDTPNDPTATRIHELRETIHLQALEAAEQITERAADMSAKQTTAEAAMLTALVHAIEATTPQEENTPGENTHTAAVTSWHEIGRG